MRYTFVIIVCALQFVACKKDRTCECKNSNSTYTSGVLENSTKHAAKKSCESLSQGDTNCYLK